MIDEKFFLKRQTRYFPSKLWMQLIKKNHFVNNIGNFFLMSVFSTNKALSKDEMISLECLLWHTSKKKTKKTASYLPEKKEGKYCPCEVISLIKDFSCEFKQLYIYHTFKHIVD